MTHPVPENMTEDEQIMYLANMYRNLKKPPKVTKTNRVWWVFIGGADPVRVETEDEAVALLIEKGQEVGEAYHRDVASPVKEEIWNRPLDEGESFHNAVIHPVVLLIHKGQPRRILPWISDPQLEQLGALDKDKADLYRKAKNDERVLPLQEHGSLLEQLNARWP